LDKTLAEKATQQRLACKSFDSCIEKEEINHCQKPGAKAGSGVDLQKIGASTI
jgi:hypothetical protein